MNALRALLLGTGLVTALAAATVLVMNGSYRRLLVELCRSENHGRFWQAFSGIAIVLTSLFGALVAVPTADGRLGPLEPPVQVVIHLVRAGLFGLLLSLAGVALALLLSIGFRTSEPTPPRMPS